MSSSKCSYVLGLPRSHREAYIATLSEAEQLEILDDIYTLMNIELSKILNYLDNVSKNSKGYDRRGITSTT